ncbi:hypothetical protein GCM10027431_16800 [Lysobacter rhizosphaerae]
MSTDPRFEIEDVLTAASIRFKRLTLNPPPPPDPNRSFSASIGDVSYHFAVGDRNRTGPPPWAIGFSKQFKKDTAALDRKVMGRILEVLEDLSDYELPFHAVGDTFKPLKGELEGCWRYRIGGDRLILQPEPTSGRLNAIAFGARGSIYD